MKKTHILLKEEECPRKDVSATAQPLEGIVWLDLTSLDRVALKSVLAQHGLPPEVTTYFLLRYPSSKLIHADTALFLVTFLTIPSQRHLFTAQELKICVTPTLVATIYGSHKGASSVKEQTLTLSLSPRAESSGRFLQRLFEGALSSYEDAVKSLTTPNLDQLSGETRRRRRRRIARLIHFLRDQQTLLNALLREGGKVLAGEEHAVFVQMEQRLARLARTAWEVEQQTP